MPKLICMASYVAFLRGINVGGHHRLKMADLRREFAAWGFQNVKTVLASGNVLFDARDTEPAALAATVRKGINETFGMDVSVVVRTLDQIKALVDQNPFNGITVTPETRRYVTLLADNDQISMNVPLESPQRDFRILRVSAGEVFSVLTLTPRSGTVNSMDLLEKEFGRNITTRNWNTITRIAES